MDQHPVPRQITTFEFKLVGFMTLRQFLYLLVFVPLGYIVYKTIPIPIINVLLGLITAGAGFVFAFVPFNDRPIDLMLKNLIKRLASPTQYFYHKDNPSLYFLKDLFYASDPHQTIAHVDSQAKLSTYLSKTAKQQEAQDDSATTEKKRSIIQLLSHPDELLHMPKQQEESKEDHPLAGGDEQQPGPLPSGNPDLKMPFVTGVVTNNKKTPLPGVLIYIKDQNETPLRLLKTNPHGVFATYNKLPPGDYTFEIKDPKGTFFFDTTKLHLEQNQQKPLEFTSKELL